MVFRNPHRRAIWALALACTCFGGVLAIGCGDDDGDDRGLPDDAVAMVGTDVITKAEYDEAMQLVAGGGEAAGSPSELMAFVMDSLIKDRWARQEAKARGIALTDAEVRSFVEKARKDGFLAPSALRKAGVTEEQLLPRLLGNQLRFKVSQRLAERAGKVTDTDVVEYYRRRRDELVVPERRDIRLVATRTRAKANAARTALAEGQSWQTVAREYSFHEASRDKGGKIAGIREREQRTGLLAAVFRARSGDISGPLEEEDSWFVFVVERIDPALQATLAQSRDEIEEHLRATRRREALEAFAMKYRRQTVCAAAFKVASCRNGPEEPGEASSF